MKLLWAQRLTSLRQALPLFALALMGVALLAVWHISQVGFMPAADSIDLTDGRRVTVRLDTAGHCPATIADKLVMDDIVEGTLQTELWDCVQSLRNTPDNRFGTSVLPHEWRADPKLPVETLSQAGRVLYSIDYQVDWWPPEGLGLWGLALTGVGQNAAVFLDGKMLGWTGSFEPAYARNHARPALFAIPDGSFSEGLHRFDIYVVSEVPAEGYLGEIYIAPMDMLSSAHRNYHFFRFITPQIIAVSTVVVSVLMLLLWFYRQQDVEYGLFGLIGLFWSVHTLDQFMVDIPLSTHSWVWLVHTSLGLMVLCSLLFIRHFLGLTLAGLKFWLLGTAVLAAVLWLVPVHLLPALLAYGWYPLLLTVLGYALVVTLFQAHEQADFELYALTTAVAVIFLLACHDFMVMAGWLPLAEGRLLHFGTPFLLLAFTWILMRRFVRSLRDAEQYNAELRLLNQELESRVEEKSKRIAQSYEMIRQLGQEQVVQQERSRIMRDMHDGIGVYLTGMLRQLEFEPLDREHLRSSAHHALNDLRLMIDSLGNASTDLPAMLGMFRTRISPLLEACQTELEWEVDELPAVDEFGPERALNLLRILQEAVTNALKHSGCNMIRLSASVETSGSKTGQIIIRVRDNGNGFVSQNTWGYGLKNMRQRARKIKAGFALDTSPEGSCITISLSVSTKYDAFTPTPQNDKQGAIDDSAMNEVS